MRIPAEISLLAGRQAQLSGNVTSIDIVVPSTQPARVEWLNPQIAGFSIEMDHWQDWAGEAVGQPNDFVNTVLGHLTERTGQPPFFRVGANSEDRSFLDLQFEVINSTFPPPTADVPAPEASSNAIGRDFYALSANLPDGTSFQWGVNLRYLNETETLSQIGLLADTFQGSRADLLSKVHLKFLEIGNEADFYAGFSETPSRGWEEWSPKNYSDTWSKWASDAMSVINLDGETKLSPGSFANYPGLRNLDFTPAACFDAGILEDEAVRSHTPQFTMHGYSGEFIAADPIHRGTLMDKVSIRSNLSMKAQDIKDTRSQGLTYVMSETNSYANHGVPGMSNGAEQVLWAVDWMLHGATMGIDRFHFHNGRGYRYNIIEPIKLDGTDVDDEVGHSDRPHIVAAYHAFLIVGEAAGTSGNSMIAEIPTTDTKLTAYGIWEDGKLARMLISNTQLYLADTVGGRPGFNVSLDGWSDGQYATVKRFHAPFSNSTIGMSWAGQDFDTESGNPEGPIVEEPIQNGVVELEASSIALICFK